MGSECDFRRFEYRKVRIDVRTDGGRALHAFMVRDGFIIDPDAESARYHALRSNEPGLMLDNDPIFILTYSRPRPGVEAGVATGLAGAESEPVPAEAVSSAGGEPGPAKPDPAL